MRGFAALAAVAAVAWMTGACAHHSGNTIEEIEQISCPMGLSLEGRAPPEGLEIGCRRLVSDMVVPEGPYRKWRPSGTLLEIGSLDEKGSHHGRVIRFHATGQIKESGVYIHGKKSGVWMYWDKSGAKRFEGAYVDGVQDGPWREWHFGGRLSTEIVFKRGSADGPWKSLVDGHWTIARGAYQNGQRDGQWSSVYCSGKTFASIAYSQGSLAKYKWYRENGEEIRPTSWISEIDVGVEDGFMTALLLGGETDLERADTLATKFPAALLCRPDGSPNHDQGVQVTK